MTVSFCYTVYKIEWWMCVFSAWFFLAAASFLLYTAIFHFPSVHLHA